jgi:hypothetical protein
MAIDSYGDPSNKLNRCNAAHGHVKSGRSPLSHNLTTALLTVRSLGGWSSKSSGRVSAEILFAVLGADRFQQLIVHLAPALEQMQLIV